MTYHLSLNNRRSIRLKGYDYSQEGLYFITLCIENKTHLFGEIEDKALQLNIFGKIAVEEWLKTAEIRNNIRLHEFVVMPNHFHAIIEITFSNNKTEKKELNTFKIPSQTIGAIIRGFKGATTKRIKEIIYQEKEKSIPDFSLSTGEFNPENSKKIFFKDKSTGEFQFAPTIAEAIDLSKSIWQRNYYEIIIRNKQAFLNISNYIKNNPKNWKKDKFHF